MDSTIQVFADLDHSGKLAGPILATPKGTQQFVITVPLPANCATRDRLVEPVKIGEDVAQRLGRLRLVAKAGTEMTLTAHGIAIGSLRLFQKSEDKWQLILPMREATWHFNAKDSSSDLVLGFGIILPEPKDDLPNANWPTEMEVEIGTSVTHPNNIRIPFRVAPFIIPSSIDPVDELWIVSQAETADAVKMIESYASKSRLKIKVHASQAPCDQWMQDTIEPGVLTFPLGDQISQVSSALCGLRKEFRRASGGLDRQIRERLYDDGVTTVIPGIARKNSRWIDWYGNLEVTPPHADRNGRRFPFGRILTGKQRDLTMHPDVMKFLEAQKIQWPPIVLDTSWLFIGHIDETVNFVPAKTQIGFKVLLPSPKAAQTMLNELTVKGFGDTPVFEGKRGETTVAKLRDGVATSKENVAIDEIITGIRSQLQDELNLSDADFVMVPVLFRGGGAVIPNAVNSAVVNGTMLAPAPCGPRQNGKDLFEEAIRNALAQCDVRVEFIDAWQAYHSSGGEVHCGTNTFRRLRDPAWWKHLKD